MANVSFINESDAPTPTAKGTNNGPTENQVFANSVLDSLVVGKAAQVAFDEGDSVKGIKRALTSQAKSRSMNISYYQNGDNLFVRLKG